MDVRSTTWFVVLASALFVSTHAAGQKMSSKVKVPAISSGAPIKRNISQIKGLLVIDLGTGDHAGTASPLTLTANKVSSKGPMQVEFNQPVGESMRKGLTEAIRGLQVKHGGWPQGHQASFTFGEKYSSKDGPSATVACALLLESLISGHDYDKGFAVTGDMNSDLSVQPVGGVAAKIRGATKKDCTVVAIPLGNKRVVDDLSALKEYEPIVGIQVFTIKTLDEALALAMAKRRPELQKAIDDFATIQRVVQAKGVGMLRNPKVKERLGSVLRAAPNHLSARTLLLAANGRAPKSLSLPGSFVEMDKIAAPFIQAMDGKGSDLKDGVLADTQYRMRKIRPQLDARVHSYHDAITDYVSLWRQFADVKVKTRTKFKEVKGKFEAAGKRVQREATKLRSNTEIQEELMQ